MGGERNQRQPGDRRLVLAFDPIKEHDSPRLELVRPGAVERLIRRDVTLDFLASKRAPPGVPE